MNEQLNEKPRIGAIALGWWSANLNADTGAARGLSARLRRACGPAEVLAHREVFELSVALQMRDPVRLALIAQTLAYVSEHTPAAPARRRARPGQPAPCPKPRFQRLHPFARPCRARHRPAPGAGDGRREVQRRGIGRRPVLLGRKGSHPLVLRLFRREPASNNHHRNQKRKPLSRRLKSCRPFCNSTSYRLPAVQPEPRRPGAAEIRATGRLLPAAAVQPVNQKRVAHARRHSRWRSPAISAPAPSGSAT